MLTLTPIMGVGLAFLIAYAVTPLVVRLARRLGAIDRPGEKIHAREMPRLGGLAIACAFYVPVLGLAFRVNAFSGQIYENPARVAALLGGGVAILLLGVYDDLKGARAWQKLIIQVPVAVLAWYAGVRIGGTASPGKIDVIAFPPALSLVMTVAWIVLVVNALNLIDGLDGLASGIALQALVATAIAAWHRDSAALALFALCLSGALSGFLVHNFHPATIFMGDSGSMFLGYILAISTVWTSQKAATMVGAVLPAIALGVPLLDTSMAVWRRLWSGRNILRGDLDHLHHRLLRLGFTMRGSVLVLYGIGFFFNLLSVLLVYVSDWRWHWPIIGAGLVVALVVARWLGYLGRRKPFESVPAPAPQPAAEEQRRKQHRV
jgi:UDP-GlcNAc:undecaprenyl-phosphate GlcNAc-1-phosphate transferase